MRLQCKRTHVKGHDPAIVHTCSSADCGSALKSPHSNTAGGAAAAAVAPFEEPRSSGSALLSDGCDCCATLSARRSTVCCACHGTAATNHIARPTAPCRQA